MEEILVAVEQFQKFLPQLIQLGSKMEYLKQELEESKLELKRFEERMLRYESAGIEIDLIKRNQLIKYKIKLVESEQKYSLAKSILQIQSSLNKELRKTNKTKNSISSTKSKILNEFDGLTKPLAGSPSRALRLLRQQFESIELDKLTLILNSLDISLLSGKFRVLNNTIVLETDLQFFNKLKELVFSQSIKNVLDFNNPEEKLFYPTDLLKLYVLYIIKNDPT